MSKIIKKVKLKNFNLEKLKETIDNSFCELINTDALCEILKKTNTKEIFIYHNDVNEEYETIKEKFDFINENSKDYAIYIPYTLEYSFECTDGYEDYLEDEYFEEDDDGFLEYTGCMEIITGGRMHSSNGIDFGDANGNDIGVILELDGEELILKRAYNGSFNIYQGGATTVDSLGEFDSKVLEFVDSFIVTV